MKNSRHRLWPGVLYVSFTYSFYLFLILSLFKCKWNGTLHFPKMLRPINAKTYMLNLELKAETVNTTCTIYHSNSCAVQLTTTALFILRIRNHQQIMTNDKSKWIKVNFIHYMANVLGVGWCKMAHFCIIFEL